MLRYHALKDGMLALLGGLDELLLLDLACDVLWLATVKTIVRDAMKAMSLSQLLYYKSKGHTTRGHGDGCARGWVQ